MREFCRDAGLSEDEEKRIGTADLPLLDDALLAVRKRDREEFSRICAEGTERYGGKFMLWAFAKSYPTIRSYYPDEAVRKATLSDIAIWVRRYEARHGGEVGLDRHGWLSRHATGTIARLGRLQYESGQFSFPLVIRNEEGEVIFREGEDALCLHIPEGEALTPSAVDDSLGQARSRFPHTRYLVCDSWLLDPQLLLVLPGEGNICRFMKRFTKFAIPMEGEPQIFERVFFFGATKADVLAFDAKTTLQKNVQKAVRLGVSFRNTGGYLAL